MTPAEHQREAEELLELAKQEPAEREYTAPSSEVMLAALVHAILSLRPAPTQVAEAWPASADAQRIIDDFRAGMAGAIADGLREEFGPLVQPAPVVDKALRGAW